MANIIHWVNIDQVEKSSFTSSSRADHDQTQISFKFSGKSHFSDWITPQDPRQPRRMVRRINQPLTEAFILVSLGQSSSTEKARETLNRELEIWPVWASGRENLIHYALDTARDVIKSMPPNHDSVRLHLRVEMLNIRIHALDQSRAIDWAIRRSIQEDEERGRMVPAVESSIESLEKKMVMDDGMSCCSVCLEDICRGCEGLVMPCLHVFHGDCIKKWLRTSHYCPVCRFEMPTRSN